MRIVSKKRDYYDIVQGTGQNFDLQYIRTEIEEPLEKYPFPTFWASHWYGSSDLLTIKEYTIGFCGKIYPCLHLKTLHPADTSIQICHSLADVDAFMQRSLRKRFLKKAHLDEYVKPKR